MPRTCWRHVVAISVTCHQFGHSCQVLKANWSYCTLCVVKIHLHLQQSGGISRQLTNCKLEMEAHLSQNNKSDKTLL